MKILYLIPARAGSKGLPGKNIKPLGDIPLIEYSINAARSVAADVDICLSTDSEEFRSMAEEKGLEVPFLRPAELASDQAGMDEVIRHALDFYFERGVSYDAVMLLQPTSPFRNMGHLTDVERLYRESSSVEMVVSVGVARHNPYFTLVEENEAGYLRKLMPGAYVRRQDCPPVYFYNGSIYLINAESVKTKTLDKFTRTIKYVMEERYSVDIDTADDWEYAEFLIQRKKL